MEITLDYFSSCNQIERISVHLFLILDLFCVFFVKRSSYSSDINFVKIVKKLLQEIYYSTIELILVMSYPCLEVVCGNCGSTINRMINLKSIRDSIRPSSGRCNKCGISLNPSDFSLNTVKQ
jgi:hypothetical protein